MITFKQSNEENQKIFLQENTLTIKDLSYWRGCFEKPQRPIYEDFTLTFDDKGYIKQVISPFVQNHVIEGYSDEKYHFITQPPGSSRWANQVIEPYFEFFKKHFDFNNYQNILEIGAGSLYVAHKLVRENNIKSYTVFDPSVYEVPALPNINVNRNYFSLENAKNIETDLIISFNCLEHVTDPYNFLRAISSTLTKMDAMALLVFPDIETQFSQGDVGGILHEHINYFTQASAQDLFEQAGLEIIQFESKFDTLMFIVKDSEHLKVSTNYQNSLNFYQAAGQKITNSVLNASQNLNKDIKDGKRIAIHGACNGANNLLQILNLCESENISIYDGDETKKGMYLSNSSKIIHHVSDDSYKEIDIVYVAAMTYYESIIHDLAKNHGIDEKNIFPLFNGFIS